MDSRETILGFSFPFVIDDGVVRTGGLSASIRGSVEIILRTECGERMLHPDFGTSILQYLFQPMNNTTLECIRTEVLNSLYSWEPRIAGIQVNFNAEDGKLIVDVSYRIKLTGEQDSVTISYYGGN